MSRPDITPLSPRKMVVANWKMHGNLARNQALVHKYLQGLQPLAHADVVVCVPYPYLAQAQSLLAGTNVAWGAQNIAKVEQGAYTGEVSADMLRDFGANYVIIGHSERSTAYCESDENIAEKFMMAKRHGLIPILCVGETLLEREAGVMERVVGKQLETIIRLFGGAAFTQTIVSYEPIWAIGTGLAASAEQAVAMHKFIRETVAAADQSAADSLKILYGGSVNPQNAVQLLNQKEIDGALVGRCSLDAEQFIKICQAVPENSVI
ncbi:triose-phosphate isomerase [Methylophilus sp.]|jgi:triosephosphate isomerase (TIM)|uniref:triose-phosphate isomerase n=1 Tax=Methylophilus sp. TaxID=29541 RepID=UPI0011DB8DC0|nr:triose-phosphate isomerase [Methylophilus sp.]TXI46692.1 MAG: triose-phosphate isomerase [Methylophilus sp.]